LFKKDNLETPPDKVNTIIGKDTCFKGTITGNGLIRIDGEAEGNIVNMGDVIIGKIGQVAAELRGHNITIAGRYEGTLEAEGKLELKRTATAIGIFKVNGLIIEKGAVLSGNMEMKLKEETGSNSAAVRRGWSSKMVESKKQETDRALGELNESSLSDKASK